MEAFACLPMGVSHYNSPSERETWQSELGYGQSRSNLKGYKLGDANSKDMKPWGGPQSHPGTDVLLLQAGGGVALFFCLCVKRPYPLGNKPPRIC